MIKNYWASMVKHSNYSKTRETAGKLKISVISILMGLFAGTMIVAFIGASPWEFLHQLFTLGFHDKSSINQFLIFTSVFILSGLANAFAFKTGLFNIGVSGQMLAGGGVAMYLSLTVFKDMDGAMAIPLLIIIAALVAASVGLFAGILKTLFNVHEVVTTILLNWILYYLVKYIFSYDYKNPKDYMNPSGDSHRTSHLFHSHDTLENGWMLAIGIAIIAVAAIFLLLKFTVFGKNLKITGINKEAANYSGINTKKSIVTSMAISASLAGVLGVVVYFGKQEFMPAMTSDALPSIGFDGIALALLAFSNPLGIVPVAMLYALFKVGGDRITAVEPAYSKELVSLVFSIMIYFAAVSTIFYKFKPISFLYKMYLTRKEPELIKLKNEMIKEEKKLLLKLKTMDKYSKKFIEAKEEYILAKIKYLEFKKDPSMKTGGWELKEYILYTKKAFVKEKKKKNSEDYVSEKANYKATKKDNKTILQYAYIKSFNRKIELNYNISRNYIAEKLKIELLKNMSSSKMEYMNKINLNKKEKNELYDIKNELQDLKKTKPNNKQMKNKLLIAKKELIKSIKENRVSFMETKKEIHKLKNKSHDNEQMKNKLLIAKKELIKSIKENKTNFQENKKIICDLAKESKFNDNEKNKLAKYKLLIAKKELIKSIKENKAQFKDTKKINCAIYKKSYKQNMLDHKSAKVIAFKKYATLTQEKTFRMTKEQKTTLEKQVFLILKGGE